MTGRRKKDRSGSVASEDAPAPAATPPGRDARSRGWLPWAGIALALAAVIAWRQGLFPSGGGPAVQTAGGDVDPELRNLIQRHALRIQEDPSAESHGTLGLVYEANELWDEAARCFELAEELDPDSALWTLHRGTVAAEGGDFDAALAFYRAAVAKDPGLAAAHFRLADGLQRSGQLDEALEHFRRAAELAPRSTEAHTGLGAALLEEDRPEEAQASLAVALSIDPDYKTAHYQLGRALRALGRDEEARRSLARGVDSRKRFVPDPLDERLRSLRVGYSTRLDGAVDLLRTGRVDDGIAILQDMHERRPDDVNVLNNLAAAYIDHRDPELARPLLEKARSLDEGEFATWINLGSYALKARDPQQALASAERAIALAPSIGRAHLVKGKALLALGRKGEAHAALTRAAELDARDPQAQILLGNVCVELERYDEAKQHLRAAARLAPGLVDPWILQARLHGALGEYLEASEALAGARRIAPDHPTIKALQQMVDSAATPK